MEALAGYSKVSERGTYHPDRRCRCRGLYQALHHMDALSTLSDYSHVAFHGEQVICRWKNANGLLGSNNR